MMLDFWSSYTSFLSLSDTPFALIYTFAALAIALLSLLTYRHYTIWSSQNIPGPRPLPIFGNSLDYSYEPMKDVDAKRVRKYGRIYGYFNGSSPTLAIADPKLVRKILVQDFFVFSGRRENPHPVLSKSLISSNGKVWKDMRSTLSPSFTSGKMKQMLPHIEESYKALDDKIREIIKSGKNGDVDSKDLFGRFTLDVIAKCAFAIQTNTYDDNDEFVNWTKKFFMFTRWKFVLGLLLPLKMKTMIGLTASPDEAIVYMCQAAERILQQRRQGGGNNSYPDLLQLLMEANLDKSKDNDNTLDNEAHHGNEEETNWTDDNITKKPMTETEMIANTVMILLAGYETTATTLSYASYCLALNPHVQDKLRDEVNKAFEADGGKLKYETLTSLKYLDAVISETLRVYPAITRIERFATDDYVLETDYEGLRKIFIPKGTYVYIPVYYIHHNSEYYTEPEKFEPERFMPERKHELTPYTYLPFVAGPRNCIGMRFALMEAKFAIANFVHKYKFVKVDKTTYPPDLSKADITLRAKSIIVGIEPL